MKLFTVLLGGKPADSTIEAHNVFFGVGPSIEALFPVIKKFWPSAPKIHIDAYMEINYVDGHRIDIIEKNKAIEKNLIPVPPKKLFFVNFGAYDEGVFEERHKKLLLIANDETEAVQWAKKDEFLKNGYTGGKAASHIDDKKTLDEFEEDTPIDVGQIAEKQGYIIMPRLLPTLDGITLEYRYPKVVITGFWKIP